MDLQFQTRSSVAQIDRSGHLLQSVDQIGGRKSITTNLFVFKNEGNLYFGDLGKWDRTNGHIYCLRPPQKAKHFAGLFAFSKGLTLGSVGEEQLWKNLEYFLRRVIPVAAAAGVKMAIHPDDPPCVIFGPPRIAKSRNDLRRILDAVNELANGLTLCSGVLGAEVQNDVVAMVKEFGQEKRIHFAHLRNLSADGRGNFQETAHYSSNGYLDMVAIIRAYAEVEFDGYARADHGRMIWGEIGNPDMVSMIAPWVRMT